MVSSVPGTLVLLVTFLQPTSAPVSDTDPEGLVGEAPYEITEVGRGPEHAELVDFEDLTGWQIVGREGCVATACRSQEQLLYGSYTAKVVYRGDSARSCFELAPPQPIPIPGTFDGVNLWVRGNNWGWESPAATVATEAAVLFRDAAGVEWEARLGRIDFDYWFLMHATVVSPLGKLASVGGGADRITFPCSFTGIRVSGCSDPADQRLFFDSLQFYTIDRSPLQFATPPANALWRTEPDAIVPAAPGRPSPEWEARPEGGFTCDLGAGIRAVFEPKSGGLGDLRFETAEGVLTPCAGGGVTFLLGDTPRAGADLAPQVAEVSSDGRWRVARYAATVEGQRLEWSIRAQAIHGSLVVEVDAPGGSASELDLGAARGAPGARAIEVPYYAWDWSRGAYVLRTDLAGGLFLGGCFDWHVAEGSEVYQPPAAPVGGTEGFRFLPGVRYHPKTDGTRNPLHERIVLSLSPRFDEVLPSLPHPTTDTGDVARLSHWRNIGFPNEPMLREYKDHGIDHFIACLHEVGWRDAGESFTLRLNAAPRNIGDAGMQAYSRFVRDLGYSFGLYTNYTDYAPVNRHWDENAVTLTPSGEWQRAWPRCYAPKGELAWEREAWFAPRIHEKFGTSGGYCDVATAVAPWHRTDADARTPGGGKYRAIWESYARTLYQESANHGGPVFSEGLYHWLYAGLADGNYAQMTGAMPWKRPPLVDFDLLRVHPLETDFGMGDPGMFFKNAPWQADRAPQSPWLDRFLCSTLAFGHIGYMTGEWGLAGTMKSYFLVQPIQRLYTLIPVAEIRYRSAEGLVDTSRALALNAVEEYRQVYVRYQNGLELWCNLSFDRDWPIEPSGGMAMTLPPAGWYAQAEGLQAWSAPMAGAGRVDALISDEVIYLDTRGQRVALTGVGAFQGAVALLREGDAWTVIPALESEVLELEAALAGVAPGGTAEVTGLGEGGREVGPARVERTPRGVRILPLEGAIKYRVRFGKPDGTPRVSVWAESTPNVVQAGMPVRVTVRARGQGETEARLEAKGLVLPEEARGTLSLRGAEARTFDAEVAPDLGEGAVVEVRATLVGREGDPCVEQRAVIEPVEARIRAAVLGAGVLPDARVTVTADLRSLLPPEAPAVVTMAVETPGAPPAEARVDLAGGASASPTVVLSASGDAIARVTLAYTIGERRVTRTRWLDLAVSKEPFADLSATAPEATTTCQRGSEERPLSPDTGAIFAPEQMPVGGVTLPGFFVHPPYQGGVGWSAGTFVVALPAGPVALSMRLGFRDGSTTADGCLFRVLVVGEDGSVEEAGSIAYGTLRAWLSWQVDLSRWSGRTVRLKLVVDVGPRDDSTSDWACIGQPELIPLVPRLSRVEVSAEEPQARYGPPPVTLEGLQEEEIAQAAGAWLVLDTFGRDDAERYPVEVRVNGVVAGALPAGRVGGWDTAVDVPLAPAAVGALSGWNRVELRNPERDCFNVRNAWIRFRLADGREGASRVWLRPLCSCEGWPEQGDARGVTLGEPLVLDGLLVPVERQAGARQGRP